MKKSLVIIPTYNEKENIGSIISVVLSLDTCFQIIVVDDDSKDGTRSIVHDIISTTDRVFILERKEKEGLGRAYIAGFKWALSRDYEFIFEMDADFSHSPKDLLKLMSVCKKNNVDVAIGSRYVKGGNVENWDIKRILISKIGAFYTKLVTGMKIQDPTAGFVCYRKEVLQKIDLNSIKFSGYAFQIEMKYKCIQLGFNVVEVPIIFVDRVKGISKMSSGIIREAIFGVIQIKIDSIMGK